MGLSRRRRENTASPATPGNGLQSLGSSQLAQSAFRGAWGDVSHSLLQGLSVTQGTGEIEPTGKTYINHVLKAVGGLCTIVSAKYGCFYHLRSKVWKPPEGSKVWKLCLEHFYLTKYCLSQDASSTSLCRWSLHLSVPMRSAVYAFHLNSSSLCGFIHVVQLLSRARLLRHLPSLPAWNVPPILLLSESHWPWIAQVPSSPRD